MTSINLITCTKAVPCVYGLKRIFEVGVYSKYGNGFHFPYSARM